MIVYPSIDILEGRCVRMTMGDFATVEDVAPSPLEAAKWLVSEGAEWLHLVDLDGARTGTPANLDHIRKIAAHTTVKLQASGGIRDVETGEAFVEAGVSRIVVGTAAVRDPDLLARLVDRHADALAVGVDARKGLVATQGWTETSTVTATDLVQTLAVAGVTTVVYTNIDVEGRLEGVDLAAVESVARAFGGDLISSGGVASLDDLRGLAGLRHRGIRGAIVGRALYRRRFTLREAMAALRAPRVAAGGASA